MRIRLLKAARLGSSLLLAVGLGVLALCGAAQAQSTTPKKSSGSSAYKSSPRKKSAKRSRRRERGQKAPTPDRISEIQQALAKDGSYGGKPNGKWDGATVEAMKKFQGAHGLNPTGKLDAKTLQQLGLGSPITGVAPPLPASTSSKLVPPSAQTTQHPR
jgi:peptidoglycan hydrolase-like protein with peptidoglycan-binding domain